MRPASGWSQHEREVVHKHRQEFCKRPRKRRRFPLAPTIGHAQLVLPALQGGEACAVPAFIFFLGVDDQMLSVCAHVQVRNKVVPSVKTLERGSLSYSLPSSRPQGLAFTRLC